MDNLEAARKILETFKHGTTFRCLHDLAVESGFKKVSNRNFKDGFNYLVREGVLKLQQSGWSSEKRGHGKNHPKTVILTADLYEVTNTDIQIDYDRIEDLGITDMLPSIQGQFEAKVKSKGHRPRTYCVDCKSFITGEPNGYCKKRHWYLSMRLAKVDKVCSYDSFKDRFFDDFAEEKKDKLVAWKNW